MTRRSDRRSRWAVSVGVALALLAVDPESTAQANYFGPSGCCYYADNGYHTFNYDSTTSQTHAALDYARSNLDGQTDMTTGYVANDGNTDAAGYDQYYTTYWNLDWDGSTTGYNIFAYTKCTSTSGTSAGNCQRYEMRYDLADMDRFNAGQDKAVTCHEVGHTVGLDHSSSTSSCLLSDSGVYRSTVPVHYDSHDVGHINGRW